MKTAGSYFTEGNDRKESIVNIEFEEGLDEVTISASEGDVITV